MTDKNDARAQRESADAVKGRRGAGIERRMSGLRSYLAAVLYAEERDPYDEQRDRRPSKATTDTTDTDTDAETD